MGRIVLSIRGASPRSTARFTGQPTGERMTASLLVGGLGNLDVAGGGGVATDCAFSPCLGVPRYSPGPLRQAAAGHAATWWDSQGAKHAILANEAPGGSSLTAFWGELGKTEYSFVDGGDLKVVDSVKRPDGSWGEFGRSRLRRQ